MTGVTCGLEGVQVGAGVLVAELDDPIAFERDEGVDWDEEVMAARKFAGKGTGDCLTGTYMKLVSRWPRIPVGGGHLTLYDLGVGAALGFLTGAGAGVVWAEFCTGARGTGDTCCGGWVAKFCCAGM